MSLTFKVTRNENPATQEEREAILANPGFGDNFTDHMVRISWNPENGWHDAQVMPFGPITISPAAGVLHYAQEIFEGMKAYRHADGSVWSFRPERNAQRLQASARRLALPELPVELYLESVRQLLEIDKDWVPSGGESSLYLRPFMFGSEAFLGVRPSKQVEYYCIASPAASYFKSGIKPLTVWASEKFSRAGAGGTGAAKCGGNYASSMLGKAEAVENGADEVMFLDSETRTFIDELSGMNVFAVRADGSLCTPALTGSILEGVTRASILKIGEELGLTPREERLNFKQVLADIESGDILEMFACGTAAVVTPIGAFLTGEGKTVIGDGAQTEKTFAIRERLLNIQYGRSADEYGWMTKFVS
ncbi:branched-chain amino acid aminotransferase [Dermabacteraceae bacterium P13115]|nr:branched-chain amino acid aminotransferase [Dermabacteraceae bacterium TAE3-ERU5]